MRFQFSTSTLLLAVTIVAITCAGSIAWARVFEVNPAVVSGVFYIGMTSPLWTPIAFLAFAIGRRSMTAKLVVAFAILEATSIGLSYLMMQINW